MKLHIFGLMALAVAGLTSCEADKDPVLQEPTEFKVNTPPFVNQLYDLSPDGVMEITCSQPNYGLALAPTYTAEVSIYPDFGASLPAPDPEKEDAIPYSVLVPANNPYSAVMELPENAIAVAICEMRGITEEAQYTDEGPRPLYIRVIAQVADQLSTRIVSEPITFPQVQGYFASNVAVLDVLYTPGNSNGWSHDNSQQLASYEEGKYRGFVYINGDFKFTSAPNWDGVNYGSTGVDGELSDDGGAGNLTLPAEGEGLYYAEVNTNDLSYTLTYISAVNIPGGFNGWNVNTKMTSTDYLHWTIKADLNGEEFKFAFNNSWDLNLGGAIDALEFGGGNMVGESGEVTVTLDLSKLPYTATFE